MCIVFQEDGVGLHTDKTYLVGKNSLFAERDWLVFNQPSQSPTLNVHDFTIFHVMSKAVSSEQVLVYGSNVMKGEELSKAINDIFNDKENIPAMSRGFARHHQVVCTSFGVRRHFVENEVRDGVDSAIPIVIPDNDEQSMAERFLARRALQQLRYLPPDIRWFKYVGMTLEMKERLREMMDPDLLAADDEVVKIWDRINNGEELEVDGIGEEEEV